MWTVPQPQSLQGRKGAQVAQRQQQLCSLYRHRNAHTQSSCPTHLMAWLMAPPKTSAVVSRPGQMGSPAASAEVHPSGRCTSLPLDRLKMAPLPHVQRPALLAGARQA